MHTSFIRREKYKIDIRLGVYVCLFVSTVHKFNHVKYEPIEIGGTIAVAVGISKACAHLVNLVCWNENWNWIQHPEESIYWRDRIYS